MTEAEMREINRRAYRVAIKRCRKNCDDQKAKELDAALRRMESAWAAEDGRQA